MHANFCGVRQTDQIGCFATWVQLCVPADGPRCARPAAEHGVRFPVTETAPPFFPVEPTFDQVVGQLGGIRVTSLFRSPPRFDNADYLFKEAGVVAELKVLELDRSKDSHTQDKIHKLYLKWRTNRDPVPLIFGKARISTDMLPEKNAWELVDVFREPIRLTLKKANRQIKETKAHLGMPDAKGLVLLVNESNVALEPGPMMQMVYQILDSQSFSGINTMVYLTINLHASAPWSSPEKTRIWAVVERDGTCDASFLDLLYKTLVNHLLQPGEYCDTHLMADPKAMFEMRNARKEI